MEFNKIAQETNMLHLACRPSFLLFLKHLSVLLIAFPLWGCSTSGLGKIADGSLELVGLKKPDAIPSAPPKPALPSEIPLTVFAGNNLNVDPQGRPLAVVLKLYKLRGDASFLGAPYGALSDAAREREALASELVEARELTLLPGQKLELRERVPEGVTHLAVAAFFRSPSGDRWRVSLPVDNDNAKGVSVGVHACAVTVSQGNVSGISKSEAASLSNVTCR